MKFLSRLKRPVNMLVTVGIVAVLLAAGGALLLVKRAHAAGDCDGNAVIPGGVTSAAGVQQAYKNGATCGSYTDSAANIQHIFAYFGIASSDVSALGSTAQVGSVNSKNEVLVNGQVVATDALTAGRQNISGSKQVTYQGTTFYTRAPSVSFASSPLSALVVMKNGTFQFAIIESCGNAVKATAKVTPKPAPTSAPTTPAPQTPAPTPTPTTPAPPKQLTNTGPGSVAALFGATAAAGTLGYRFYLTRRLGRE